MTPLIQSRVDYWLTGPFDEQTKSEVAQLQKENPKELVDAFYSDLSFGTGGMRGIMGPGTARINLYTIRLATQGLANYLRKQIVEKKISVLIGFDSRHHSQEFAEEAAKVLSGNGIHVYLLDVLRPTPYVSFACREKKADAAIMITASHNPKEYNGYKVYWSDGGQVVSPHDVGIVSEVEKLRDFSEVKSSPLSNPLIEKVPVARTLDSQYFQAILPLQQKLGCSPKKGSSLQIVYTSLHGTGITMTPQALRDWGFSQIHCVEKQVIPDGDFPTVHFPNPEYQEALQMGIDLLTKTQSDILIANDPDADRVGVAILHEGNPVILNGNEVAAICIEYLIQVMEKQGTLPKLGAFVTTIVSTPLLQKIASSYGKLCIEVLTGFKYIGEKIHQWETVVGGPEFIFGAEESYGYLLGTHARDKDAIVSSCLISQIASDAKDQGKTLQHLLEEIYRKHGVYREKQLSIEFSPGIEGMKKIDQVMDLLRNGKLDVIGGSAIIQVVDYLLQTSTDRRTCSIKQVKDLPVSNVISYFLEDKSRVIIRPSGTEPKVKVYASVSKEVGNSIQATIQECDDRLDHLLESIRPVA